MHSLSLYEERQNFNPHTLESGFNIKHYSLKIHGLLIASIYVVLTSAQVSGDWLASRPRHFYPQYFFASRPDEHHNLSVRRKAKSLALNRTGTATRQRHLGSHEYPLRRA